MKGLHAGEGNNYIDRNGDSKQFSTVDWSAKTSISVNTETPEQLKALAQKTINDAVSKVLSFHPTLLSDKKYYPLAKRGDIGKIIWNEEAVKVFISNSYYSWDIEWLTLIQHLEVEQEKENNLIG